MLCREFRLTALLLLFWLIPSAAFSETAEPKDLHAASLSVGAEYGGVTPDDGEVLFTGPVGIGTANPADKFQVVGGNLVVGATESSQPNLSLGGNGIQARTGLNFASNLVLNSLGGSVGIGTASPLSHIEEETLVLDLTSAVPVLAFHPAGSTFEGAIKADGTSLFLEASGADRSDDSQIIFRTHPSSGTYNVVERMRIAGNGNVGIGTPTPQAPLEVFSSNDDPVLRLSTPNSDATQLYIRGSKNHVVSIGTSWRGGNASFIHLTRDSTDGGRSWQLLASDAPDYAFSIGHPGGAPALAIDTELACTGRFVNTSDIRLKKNVVPLSGVLERLRGIQAVRYEWAGRQPAPGYAEGARQIGVIAQELEKVYPELVVSNGPAKAVDYMRLTAVLLEAVKEQQEEIKDLKDEISLLKNR